MSTTVTTTRATPGTGVDSRHPLYTEFLDDWTRMRDTYRGQRIVKEKGFLYLPATSGMIADGISNAEAPGFKAYSAYKTRAHFPDIVNDAVEAMIGVMHHKPPTIELPEALEPMRTNATLRHETLEMLLRRINEEQLVTGRLGLLLDLPEMVQNQAGVTPYIAMYAAEKVINWDEGRRDGIVVDNLNLVVLDESEYERKRDFEWEFESKFRVLALGDPNQPTETDDSSGERSALNLPKGQGTYQQAVFRETNRTFNAERLVTPSIRGTTLEEIPFVFINSKDVVPEPEEPPLIGLADLALLIYRGEADYRQALFMQGQDTLLVVGASEEQMSEGFRTGANASITLPIGGSAEFIGVDSSGLPEMRQALENDRSQAGQKGGQLLDSVSRERESGEALSVRVAARTATLNQIALAGAFGLEQLLRMAATWVGANPDDVSVTPNLDFIDDKLGGKELVDLMTAKSLGAPLSLRSVHEQMQDKDMTSMTFEEELSEIESEEPLGGSTDEDGPEPDEEEQDPEDDGGTDDET